MKPEDIEVYQKDSITKQQLLRANRDLKKGRFPGSASAPVQKYATAEFIVSEVNKLKTAEEKEGILQEFKEMGFLTPEVQEGVKMINKMKEADLSKTDREMFIYEPGLIRAQKIIVRVDQIDTSKSKEKYLQNITEVGLLDEKTKELIIFLNGLIKEEKGGWRDEVMGIQISGDKPLFRVSPTPQSTVRIEPATPTPQPTVRIAPSTRQEATMETGNIVAEERYIIDDVLEGL